MWHLVFYFLAVCIAIAVVWGAITYIIILKKEREEQATFRENARRLHELIARAEVGDEEAHAILCTNGWNKFALGWQLGNYDPDAKPRYSRVCDRYARDHSFAENLPKIVEVYTEYRRAQDSYTRLRLLSKLLRSFQGCWGDSVRERVALRLGVVLAELLDELNQLITVHYNDLCSRALDDAGVFKSLGILINSTGGSGYRYVDGVDFTSLNVAALKRPDRWNEMVAQHVANPVYADFVNPYGDDIAGATSLRAARALWAGDLVEAKMVFAICNYNRYMREEVGDHLWKALVEMIAAQNQEIEMASKSATTDTEA